MNRFSIPASPPRKAGARILWPACLLALFCLANLSPAATNLAPPRVIGIEGNVSVKLARGDYQPRPLDDRTPLILRVEKITPAGDGRFAYDFHYIGFEPGEYKLAEYLIHPDGSLASEIGGQLLSVRSTLPANYDGVLNPYIPRPFPWFGGYRMFLGFLAFLWVGGLAAFIYLGRKKKVLIVPVTAPPAPSFAERMRPLVEAAAAGKISTAGQAELERLMTGYWREKLALPDQRMADAVAELKRHAEAGALVRALERWLHRPGGVTREEVSALLEPYRRQPAPAEMQEVAA